MFEPDSSVVRRAANTDVSEYGYSLSGMRLMQLALSFWNGGTGGADHLAGSLPPMHRRSVAAETVRSLS
ncbi:MAG: hypothetical protein WBW26_02570, partial [Bradyrhizobium sp.]|uniref:hypothetical protein n=1 Tax=Bradyrhizobium sp. TaxID=376 RepID=UPI003C4C18E2